MKEIVRLKASCAHGIRLRPHLCLTVSLLVTCGTFLAGGAQGQSASHASNPVQLSIDATKIISTVSPNLYGLMTEEINHSYDGGLYAELIQNRTFRTTWEGVEHWGLVRHGNSSATMEVVKTDGPSHALPNSLKLTVTTASAGNDAGISNPGYWGIEAHTGETYRGSFYARVEGAFAGPIHIRLISDSTGVVLASALVSLKAKSWKQYTYTLTAKQTGSSIDNHLEITMSDPGTVYLQLVSLMPPTFNHRPNGNRSDLMERMAAMHPHFLRLPGGNYLEGDRLEDWYNWKQTIGPLVDRPGHQAPWSYWSSDGLGFLEFLEWCEDLKVEPLLAVYAGYALHGDVITPGPDLEPFVQSALDEVEYVTGGPDTKWGARRAKDGHPAPFPLHYIEIGNEDWFDKSGSYDARYTQIARALRKTYPQYKLIATTPVKGEAMADDARPDLIDDHYYKSPSEMMNFVHHYDSAPRNGPKIFVGEWATRSGTPTPNFGDALGDAAWMTSMERNSDLITMASYAPLLVNVNPGAMQWSTDLIGFNAKTSYGSPSYYAQSLFAGHLGQGTVQTTITGASERLFYSATVDTQRHMLHLKFVNATDQDQPFIIDIKGLGSKATAHMMSLHGATYEATNSIDKPDAIHPVDSMIQVGTIGWKHTVPSLTIEVLDIPIR